MKIFIEEQFSSILNLISDEKLNIMIIDIWVHSAKGHWDTESIKKASFMPIMDKQGINIFDHILAVARNAHGIADSIENTYPSLVYRINRNNLLTAALLKDIGKLGKGKNSISESLNILKTLKCPEQIVKIIEYLPDVEKGRQTITESVILYYAEKSLVTMMKLKSCGLYEMAERNMGMRSNKEC